MAAVPITITGVLYDKMNKTQQTVTIMGLASLTGLGVGGGPMPPGQGGGGVHPMPPVYYPPVYPAHPIYNPPVDPGYGVPEPPPSVGGGPIIPPPEEPVQPPIEWKAVWHPTEGWIVVGVPQFPHPSPSK